MKPLIYILSGLLFVNSIPAQDYSKVKYNLETPFTGIFTAKRFTGEYRGAKYLNGKGEITNSAHIEYKRSKDGLRDTVFTGSGASRIDEYIYSEENRLVGWKELFFDIENNNELVDFGCFTEYIYDQEGRIDSINSVNSDDYKKTGSIIYNYTEHTITDYSFTGKNGSEIVNLIHIEYTDSGYICRDTTYHTVVIDGRDTSYIEHRQDEYIFDFVEGENRLKRIRGIIDNGNYKREYDSYISYQENGYTVFYGNHLKEEYFFDEKEDVILILYSRRTENGEWELIERTECFYEYNNDPQSNTSPAIENQSQPVYGIEGGMMITAEANSPVCIYTISGQLVKKMKVQPNQPLPISKGIYIVTMNNQSYKVRVR